MAWLIALFSVSGLAQQQGEREGAAWLSGKDIERTFSGRTLKGHYADKRPFEETYKPDGGLVYEEPFRRLTRGRWSVRADAFCTIYETDPTGGCYRVRRVGPNCWEFYFIARTEELAEENPGRPSWTARGWYRDQPASCREMVGV